MLDFDFIKKYLMMTVDDLSDEDLDQIDRIVQLELMRREAIGYKKKP